MIAEPRPLAIIASREDVATLRDCIASVLRACQDGPALIDVLVNGNPALAQQVADARIAHPDNCTLRIWSIRQGDKAHAWNEYVHRIWPGRGDAVFLDGYVELEQDALAALDKALAAAPEAQAATGVPTSGRSAASLRELMLREGGFHGNLNVIRADVMQALRSAAIRLPLGLYRTDSVTGALLMYGLDPAANQWDQRRIAVTTEAVWKVRLLEQFAYKKLLSQWKRVLRQAQGELENRAVREHLTIRRLAPNLLPATSQALVSGWIAQQPGQARRLFYKRPLCAYAAWRLRTPRDWSAAAVAPAMVAQQDARSAARHAGAQ